MYYQRGPGTSHKCRIASLWEDMSVGPSVFPCLKLKKSQKDASISWPNLFVSYSLLQDRSPLPKKKWARCRTKSRQHCKRMRTHGVCFTDWSIPKVKRSSKIVNFRFRCSYNVLIQVQFKNVLYFISPKENENTYIQHLFYQCRIKHPLPSTSDARPGVNDHLQRVVP